MKREPLVFARFPIVLRSDGANQTTTSASLPFNWSVIIGYISRRVTRLDRIIIKFIKPEPGFGYSGR